MENYQLIVNTISDRTFARMIDVLLEVSTPEQCMQLFADAGVFDLRERARLRKLRGLDTVPDDQERERIQQIQALRDYYLDRGKGE
jgi:hypothetical protein